jgi:hypothetical protein
MRVTITDPDQIRRNQEFDHEAHKGRVALLGVDLGFGPTKFVLRALQALRLYPKA